MADVSRTVQEGTVKASWKLPQGCHTLDSVPGGWQCELGISRLEGWWVGEQERESLS